jgi:hypothetical protein
VPVPDDYFDATMVNRQRLLWAIATRRQLERWEPIVAALVRDGFASRPLAGADVWSAEVERHFALVAARNLFRALDLPPRTNVTVDSTLRSELIEGRDLQEHWTENMPVFNVTPRPTQPKYPTGKAFADRNPRSDPYCSSLGTTRPALGSCRTSLLQRSISCSTRLRPTSSPPTPGSATMCRRAHHHRGFTRTASGGRRAKTPEGAGGEPNAP